MSIFKDSKITTVARYPDEGQEIHGKEAGSVMTVAFELAGQSFVALNGGPHFKFDEAISFQVYCDCQDEVDHFWSELSAGGNEGPCGWLQDNFGLPWRVLPVALLNDDGPRAKKLAGDESFPADEEIRIAASSAPTATKPPEALPPYLTTRKNTPCKFSPICSSTAAARRRSSSTKAHSAPRWRPIMRFKEGPDCMEMPEGTGEKVLHSCFRIGETGIIASDGYCKGKPDFQGFSLSIVAPDKSEADRLFKALEPGGQVQMPLSETFFSPRFGMVADRFGVSWMIVTMPEGAKT